jgi:predicted  nucleic acid-binding Zn-ribbon protein
MDEFKVRKADLFEKGTQNKSSEFRELRDNLAAAENNFKSATNKAAELRRELKNMVVVEDLDEDIKAAEKALQDAQNAAEKLKSNLDSVTADELARAFDEAKKKLEGLSSIDLGEITNIDDLTNLLNRFTNEGVEGLVRSLSDAGVEIRELGNAND